MVHWRGGSSTIQLEISQNDLCGIFTGRAHDAPPGVHTCSTKIQTVYWGSDKSVVQILVDEGLGQSKEIKWLSEGALPMRSKSTCWPPESWEERDLTIYHVET